VERGGETRTPGGVGFWQAVALAAMALTAAAVLVALIWTLGGANRERDQALERQRHSYDVMILARTLAGTIARSEASLGRYVISGDKQLGQLYYDEWLLAGGQIDRLDRITDDNSDQGPAVERLRAAYDARGRELSTTALSTTYGKNRLAFARYYQARKAASLTGINRELDSIITRERELLDTRATAAEASVDASSRIAGVLAVFGVLIVLGAIALGWPVPARHQRTGAGPGGRRRVGRAGAGTGRGGDAGDRGTSRPGGQAPPGAEDGRGRPADGRHRPRLQQHAGRRARRTGARQAGAPPRRGAAPPRQRHRGCDPRRGAHPPPARLQPRGIAQGRAASRRCWRSSAC